MEQIQFINTSPDILVSKLAEYLMPKITECLSEQLEPKPVTEYLTRNEVCDLLKIDSSTLWRWQKKGIVQAYSVANRVYFKREEIDDLITKNRI